MLVSRLVARNERASQVLLPFAPIEQALRRRVDHTLTKCWINGNAGVTGYHSADLQCLVKSTCLSAGWMQGNRQQQVRALLWLQSWGYRLRQCMTKQQVTLLECLNESVDRRCVEKRRDALQVRWRILPASAANRSWQRKRFAATLASVSYPRQVSDAVVAQVSVWAAWREAEQAGWW